MHFCDFFKISQGNRSKTIHIVQYGMENGQCVFSTRSKSKGEGFWVSCT